MNNKIHATKTLEIEDVKIYKSKDGQPSIMGRGKLEILYLREFDTFLLRQKSFNYVLTENTLIMATLFEKNSFRSYLLPNVDGYYLLKLKSQPAPSVLKNLETILCNSSQLSYRSGQEEPTPVPEKENKNTNRLSKAGNFLKKGGDVLKGKLLGAADKIDRKFINKEAKNENPNQFSDKTIQQLKGSNSNLSPVIEIPQTEIDPLFEISKQIDALTISQIERNKRNKSDTNQETVTWNQFGKTTVESAQLVWQGMEEAASTLFQAIKRKKSGKPTDKDLSYQQMPAAKGIPQYNDAAYAQDVYDRSTSNYMPLNDQGFEKAKYPDLLGPLVESTVYRRPEPVVQQGVPAPILETMPYAKPEYEPERRAEVYPREDSIPLVMSSVYQKPGPSYTSQQESPIPVLESTSFRRPEPEPYNVPEVVQQGVPVPVLENATYENSGYEPQRIAEADQREDVIPLVMSSVYQKPRQSYALEVGQQEAPVPVMEDTLYQKQEPEYQRIAEAEQRDESAPLYMSSGYRKAKPESQNDWIINQQQDLPVPLVTSSDYQKPELETGVQTDLLSYQQGYDSRIDKTDLGKVQFAESEVFVKSEQMSQPQNEAIIDENNDFVVISDESRQKMSHDSRLDNTGLSQIQFAQSEAFLKPEPNPEPQNIDVGQADKQENCASYYNVSNDQVGCDPRVDNTGLSQIQFAESMVYVKSAHSKQD